MIIDPHLPVRWELTELRNGHSHLGMWISLSNAGQRSAKRSASTKRQLPDVQVDKRSRVYPSGGTRVMINKIRTAVGCHSSFYHEITTTFYPSPWEEVWTAMAGSTALAGHCRRPHNCRLRHERETLGLVVASYGILVQEPLSVLE